MLRLIGLVVSIGIADSLNPTTIAPALYLASGEHPRRRVAQFTIGVFLVYFVGGAVIALGPGELILAIVPRPEHVVKHVVELIAGAAMLPASVWLWLHRERLSQSGRKPVKTGARASVLLGATITAVELPTAFPYFAVITAIVSHGLDPGRQLILLLMFNICFVAPLLAIAATLYLAGDRAAGILTRARGSLQRNWPRLLSGVALVAGFFVIVLGVTGLLVSGHSDVNGLARGIRHVLHLSTKP